VDECKPLLAGWAHFIVFDLWTARFFVMDSRAAGVPHLAVVPCILGCMFFGPLGRAVQVDSITPRVESAYCFRA
jgi:hypothetical protein